MPKPKPPDYIKFFPMIAMAVSLIAGYVTLHNKVAEASNRIDKVEVIQTTLSRDTGEIRVSQAKTEATLDAVYELVKDLKKK